MTTANIYLGRKRLKEGKLARKLLQRRRGVLDTCRESGKERNLYFKENRGQHVLLSGCWS